MISSNTRGTTLIHPIWCPGTFKKEIFQKFSFLTNGTPQKWRKGTEELKLAMSRHFKDIFRLRGILRHPRPDDSFWSYDGNWCASVCFNLFRCLIWSAGPKVGQKEAKNSRFYPPKSWKCNFVALIFCCDIYNDF